MYRYQALHIQNVRGYMMIKGNELQIWFNHPVLNNDLNVCKMPFPISAPSSFNALITKWKYCFI